MVHVLVPQWIDDPTRPSGGNTYDRRICAGLTERGCDVRVHLAAGPWPRPTPADLLALADLLDQIADDAIVLVDGLIGSAAESVLVPRAHRLRLVLLVHLPLGMEPVTAGASPLAQGERAALAAAAAVVTTSDFARGWVLDHYGMDPAAVHTARPGVDPAQLSRPSVGGGRLLCVAAVTPVKGHDVLLAALAGLGDISWQLTCIGSMSVDTTFAAQVRGTMPPALQDRVRWVGPLSEPELSAAYGAADLLLVPSRLETYGMAATEALARGVPVLGSAVGGLPEAIATAPDSTGPDSCRPALLVPPGEVDALRAALRRWLSEPPLRESLRAAASARRPHLRSWGQAVADVSRVLTAVAAGSRCATRHLQNGAAAAGRTGAMPGVGMWAS